MVDATVLAAKAARGCPPPGRHLARLAQAGRAGLQAVVAVAAALVLLPAQASAQSEPPRLQGGGIPARAAGTAEPPRLQGGPAGHASAAPAAGGAAGPGPNVQAVPAPPVGIVPTLPPGVAAAGPAGSAGGEPWSEPDGTRLASPAHMSVQRAWTIGVPAPGQEQPGIKRVAWDGGGVVRVTTRRYVYTTIVLPGCEVIEQVLMGDPVNWAFRLDERDAGNPSYRPARNRVDILPKGSVGIDTTASLITASGRIYPFYLASTDVDAPDIPDVVVQVEGARLCGVDTDLTSHVLRRGTPLQPVSARGEPVPRAALPGERADGPLARPPGLPEIPTEPGRERPDYLRHVPVSVQDLRFDQVQILVPEEASRAIAPLRVYDDGRWTYIDFGVDRIDSMRLPQAYVNDDGIDHLVNTALSGDRGEILIVKAVADITLKSGRLYVCLRRAQDQGLQALWRQSRGSAPPRAAMGGS